MTPQRGPGPSVGDGPGSSAGDDPGVAAGDEPLDAVGDDTPVLTVSAVARRLGVAPATLRTWDRRYGLGPSAHTSGAHRRYTSGDLARLEQMRRLVVQGVTPADAARRVRDRPDGARTEAAASGASAGPAVAHPGGGRVVPLPDAGPAAHGLARAALALDAATVSEVVRDALARRGVLATWSELLLPVLVGVGERWEATRTGVDAEHLLSECVIGALRTVTDRLGTPRNPRPVLLACAEEEQHSLPLHAVAAGLAERHVGARLLGARVPGDALADAVRRTGPAVVMLWSQLPATGDPAQLAAVPRLRPAPLVVAGGPGWPRDGLPAGVAVPADLPEAVARVVGAVGG